MSIAAISNAITKVFHRQPDPLRTAPQRLPVTRQARRGDLVYVHHCGQQRLAQVVLAHAEGLGLDLVGEERGTLRSGLLWRHRQDTQCHPLTLAVPDDLGHLCVW